MVAKRAQDIAENVWVTLTSRAAIIIVAFGMLPLAGYTGALILDGIRAKQQETTDAVNSLAHDVKKIGEGVAALSAKNDVADQQNREQDRRLEVVEQRTDTLAGMVRGARPRDGLP